jgi:hypothetical protein
MRRFGAGAAIVTVAASLLVIFVPAAGASDAPSISIDSPGPGAVVDTSSIAISGRASMHPLAGLETNTVTRVSVSLDSPVGGPLPGCDPCNEGEGFSVPFSWSTDLAYNGPYTVSVSAAGREGPIDLNGEEAASASLDFQVAAPPGAPGGVKAAVNPDRTVTVSWERNGEPDMIGYRVQRRDPGSQSFVDAGALVGHPSSSLVDPAPATAAGGAYAYRVQAIRVGGSGGPDTALGSSYASTGADVPTPDGRPAPPAGVGPGDGGGAAPPAAGAPPDIVGFLSGGGGPPNASLPAGIGLPGPGDPGFDPTLPYPGGLRRDGDDPSSSVAFGSANVSSGGRALAVPVAAGLLLGVLAFHLRLLSRRLPLDDAGRG